MESARRGLQIVRFAMLLSIVLYFIIATRIPAHVAPNPLIFRVLALLAVANLGLVVFFRTIFVRSPAEVLRSSPQDSSALAKWKSGQVLTWAFAEAIALYGLVLHFLGFPIGQVAPFFLAGALLIVIFAPNLPD
jgi:hypothetical protein